MKQCVNCGREIDDPINICPYCGTIQKRDPKYVAVVLTIGGIAIIALVLFLVFSLRSLFSHQVDNSSNAYREIRNSMRNEANIVNASEEYVAYNQEGSTSNSASVRDNYSQDASNFQNAISRFNPYSDVVSKANLNSQEAKSHNSIFESYFGTDVTATEAKSLLSEIRTNNLTASRNEECATIGVCLVSPDATADERNGIYGMTIDSKSISDATFENYTFTPDVSKVTLQLKPGKNYTINVANSKVWNEDQEGKTGFEIENDPLGQAETGTTGGYYSSGYIRLIYIVENS